MISIRAGLGAGEYYNLDVDQSEVISLTKQLLDLTDIQKRKGDFTRSFFLPATENNVRYFGLWSDVGFQSSVFSQYALTPCLLYEDDNLVLIGNLSLEKFTSPKGFFEVVVYGQINVLTNILQEKVLADMSGTGTWGHNHDQTTILASWNLAVISGKVVYPIVDRGYGYGYNSWDITKVSTPVVLSELSPALKFVDLIDTLFTSNGLVLGNYADLATRWANIFMQLTEDVPAGSPGQDDFTAILDILPPAQITITTTSTKIPFIVPAGNPNFSNPNNDYTAPYTGTYFFSVLVDTHSGLSTNTNFLELYVNNVLNTSSSQAQNIAQFSFSFSLALTAGDVVDFRIRTSLLNVNNYILSTGGVDNWKLLSVTTTDLTPPFYNPLDLMVNTTQIGFLQAILEVYNMIIVPDPADPYKYYMYFIEDWFTTGKKYNWSEKIDLSRVIDVVPTTDLLNRNVILSWKDSEDWLNKTYSEEQGYNYGTFIGNLDIANAKEFIQKSSLFAPIPTDFVLDRTDMVIAKWLKSYDEATTLQKPSGYQLFWYNGNTAIGNYRLSYLLGGTTSVVGTYPACSCFEEPITIVNETVNFGYSPPLPNTYIVISVPEQTIFTLHWERFFQELYDSANRILKAYFILNPDDIENLQFNDIIQLDWQGTPADWRVTKVDNYKLNRTTPTKVWLSKALYGTVPGPRGEFRIVANGVNIVDDFARVAVVNNNVGTSQLLGRNVISNDGTTGNYLLYNGAEYTVRPNLPFTIGVWAEIDNIGRYSFLNKGIAGSATQEFVLTMAGGNINFVLYSSPSTNNLVAFIPAPAVKAWHLIAVTYDGSGTTAGMKMYFDGVEVTPSYTTNGTWSDVPRNNPVQSLRDFDGSNYSNAFKLDLIRYYSGLLTPGEIQNIYNDEKSLYGL